MFRNREFKKLIFISLSFVLIEIWLVLNLNKVFQSQQKDWKITIIVCFVSIIVVYVVYIVWFTAMRYRKIAYLSKWLFKLQGSDDDSIAAHIEELKQMTGHEEYKLSDYVEGELSILQNDIHKVTVRMIELNEKLLKDKTYLADTLADISHQLKTPMTSMMVMADLLNDENLPSDKRQEFTGNIQNQLERMEWLLSTLLKMSKLDAGTLKLNISKVDIKKMLEKSVSHLIIPMELKNQTLTIVCNESVGESIMGNLDENWTVEAISNIVKNCMEHTPEGGSINIEYGENPIYTYISISDTGEGISEEDLPHIFERFYKGKNAGKDSVGIGLAFAKQIINMENGSIEVTSKNGEGSCFFVKFYKSSV